MKDLFNEQDNNEIIERVNKLTATTKPGWGKMTVSQVLRHTQITIEVALGEKVLKGGIMAFLFGKMAKKQMVSEAPFKKNLPTAKSFIIKEDSGFEEERKRLTELIQRFGKTNMEEIAKRPHPFFGNLTAGEWNTLQWKHLDHHLRQFGV